MTHNQGVSTLAGAIKKVVPNCSTDRPWDAHGNVGIVDPQDFHSPTPFKFENGQQIPELNVRYETYGTLNPERNNAILICHALSGDHHCAGYHKSAQSQVGGTT